MMKANFDPCAFPEALCPDCSTCQKSIGVFQCVGCEKAFCSLDTVGHRQLLRRELQELIHEGEQYNAYWTEEIRKRQSVLKTKQDNVIEQIIEWENRSIAKIRQASAEAREQTRKLFEHHTDVYPKCISLDISALKRAMETDGFVETHLEIWRRKLQCWKSRATTFAADFIRIRRIEPFISKLIVEGEYTICAETDLRIEQNPEVFVPPVHLMVPVDDDFPSFNEDELRTGVHTFRYKSKCIFFGVSSKRDNLPPNPWQIPSTQDCTNDDLVYLNANPVRGQDRYRSNFELGDTYVLEADCDRKVICLTNERTSDTHVLDFDPTKYPLPWQLNVRFIENIHS